MKWLEDITVDEVSLVDKAANKKSFAFVKRDQTDVTKNEDAAKKAAEERAAAEAEEKRKADEAAKVKEVADAKELEETLALVEDFKTLNGHLAQL